MSEKIVIKLNERQIRGIKNTSQFSGAEYYSFFGIPYGKPPINNLRFKDPVKAQPWRGTFDATGEKYGCIQYSFLSHEIAGSEDCLFNNIHIPKLPRKNEPLRPVIVCIHPGAFHFGSPHTKCHGSPEFIMHHDVVYVCVSYRLHILGFLNLRLKECSGNQGIKDVVLSLKWINENIQSFGGDPTNVTLVGCSSGSTITHILMLSPAAKGLFHKAVMMGSYLGVPCAALQESNESHARELAASLGYNGNLHDHKKLLLFLKKQDPLLLIAGCRRCQKSFQEKIAPIFPIAVFGASLDQGEILAELPTNEVGSMAPVPLIMGCAEIESAMGFIRSVVSSTERNFKNSLRQSCFGWGYRLTDDDIRSIYEEVESFYLNGQPVEQAPLPLKMMIQTDVSMSDLYDSLVNPLAEDLPSSVFIYKFEYEGNIYCPNNSFKDVIKEPVKGTFHGGEFSYWNRFGDPGDRESRQMVESFTKLITTFAKTGNPNYENFPIKWRSSTPDNPCYLSINNQFDMVDGKVNNDRLEFWDRIKKKYKTT